MCRRKCNLKITSLINCTGHQIILHRTPKKNWGLRFRTSNAINQVIIEIHLGGGGGGGVGGARGDCRHL